MHENKNYFEDEFNRVNKVLPEDVGSSNKLYIWEIFQTTTMRLARFIL